MTEITINLHDQPCGNCTVCIGRTIGAKHEQERIIKLLEEHEIAIDGKDFWCVSCSWEKQGRGKGNLDYKNMVYVLEPREHFIALIKGEK